MDGVKEEPPANEEEDDGRGAWNTVHLGIVHLQYPSTIFYTEKTLMQSFYIYEQMKVRQNQ